jgi:hypothetical protein
VSNGLTKTEEKNLRDALAWAKAANRPAYFGGRERLEMEQLIRDIELRLAPHKVSSLLERTNRICGPLEYLLANIDQGEGGSS